jgi:putative addiction module component (TIGR02574 family)
MGYEQLLAQALDLPPEQRGDLAARLIESLDPPGDDDPAEVEAAWAAEVERRMATIEDGTAVLVPGPEALAQIRGELFDRRGTGGSQHHARSD